MKVKHIKPEDRLGMSREEAAEYVGVSTFLFDELVDDGRMPKPKVVNSRRVWSRAQIEKAFAALPTDGESLEVNPQKKTSPWSEMSV